MPIEHPCKSNFTSVILQCEAAKKEIIGATGNSRIHAFALDLASQADVKRFAREVLRQFPEIHVLVNNAGTHGDIQSMRRRDTTDGYETIMATNYLGHFTLTYLLGSSFVFYIGSHAFSEFEFF